MLVRALSAFISPFPNSLTHHVQIALIKSVLA